MTALSGYDLRLTSTHLSGAATHSGGIRLMRLLLCLLATTAAVTVLGCQTWVRKSPKQTLPEVRYLEHPPQYIPPADAPPGSVPGAGQLVPLPPIVTLPVTPPQESPK